MKLLIAYDRSHCSESALDDLGQLGLADHGEALVITVAETWLPPPDLPALVTTEAERYIERVVAPHRLNGERLLREAGLAAKHGAARVKDRFPKWSVEDRATFGSPTWEILAAADEFKPDLILMGSHGHSALGRLILGSVSQKVLTEAHCSVRIARGRIETDSLDPSQRLLIGFDGSGGAQAAVGVVASRKWRDGTEVRLVSATDSPFPAGIGRFTDPDPAVMAARLEDEYSWLTRMVNSARIRLEENGLKVTTDMLPGNPNDILVSEAQKWHADCIFVGANAAGTRLERFLLGTTSSAVASRAHCSVEVVRR